MIRSLPLAVLYLSPAKASLNYHGATDPRAYARGYQYADCFAGWLNLPVHENRLGYEMMGTSKPEVTQISTNGTWLLLGEKEYFLSFDNFPWFKDASVSAIHNVSLLNANHLYWADLDVDLAVESIKHPDRFPLVSK